VPPGPALGARLCALYRTKGEAAALEAAAKEALAWTQWMVPDGATAAEDDAALSAARPDGVDVASGVAGPDGVLKDAEKVARFCAVVREWAAANAAPIAASG